MPFEKAKTIISKEIKEKKAVLETDAKAYYDTLKGKLSQTEEDFSHYVKKLDYPGNKKDVDAYHLMVKTKMKEMLKDKKATAEEMAGFYKLMFGKSEGLKSKLIEGERKHEENKFKKVKGEVEKDVEGAKFKEAKEKLSALLERLNPLNRTDTTSGRVRYNLKENFLRVDMRILQERTAVLEAEISYETVFKAADSKTLKGGNYFEGMSPPNYIIAKKDGQITLGAPAIDPQSGEITVSNARESNWLTLSENIGRNHYGAKRLRIARDEADKFIFEGTDFTEGKNDERRNEILRNRAQLAEIRILKQINAIYTMKGMESLPEEQKERMKKALKENLNAMRLYFFEFNGQVLTTEEFENSEPIKKQMIFKKMLSGVGRILKRMELEETIKTLKGKETLTSLEQGKLKFTKGELAIREGRFIDAYSQFRGFLGMDGQPHDMELKASKYIHMASLGIVDIANRYIAASVGEVPETVINQALDQTGNIRRILEQHEWMNLEDAMTKADSSWRKSARTGKSGHYLSRGVERKGGGTSQLFPTSSMGSSRVILTLRGHILKRLALVATVIDDKDRQKALLNQAQYARKSKHYAAAGVLLKEAMRGEMNKHRRELQKDPEYWKKVKEFRRFSYFDRLSIVAKVAPRMAKKMVGAKKYKTLPQKEKDKLISRLTQMILQKRVKAREREYVFKSYLKKYKGTRSVAADSFIDMENPFDDLRPWKWSDKAWDGIKKAVLIDGVMIAVSGGLGGMGREAAVVGGRALIGRYLGTRIAASLPARVVTSLIGFGVEVLTFETAMRIQQRGINEKTFEGFWEGAWHSARTLGIMNVGGKFASRILRELKPFSHIPAEELGKFRRAIQKAVPRTISVAGFEAPLMTYLSMRYDDNHGMSALQIYANALKDIAAISIGHAVVNSASGNLFPRAMQSLAKRRRIMEMIGGRKVSEQVSRALESIKETGIAMKEFLANPDKFLGLGEYVASQADGLLVLKLTDPSKLTPENRKTFENFKRGAVEKLRSFGISTRQALQLFEGLTPGRLSQIYQSVPREVRKMRDLERTAEYVNYRTREQTLDALGATPANRQLLRDTYFDRATGLMNRNGLSRLEAMIRSGKRVTVASYDADHFRAYNDLKGTEFGDKVIKLIGRRINEVVSTLRAKGYEVYGVRMGGEEIVIFGESSKPGFKKLLREEMQKMAHLLKEDIRRTLTKREISKMAKRIAREKYNKGRRGFNLAKKELGGSTAAVVEIDTKKLKSGEGAAKRLLIMADEILENRKNKTGRGQIIEHKLTAAKTAVELAKFQPRNDLDARQNVNLAKQAKELFSAAAQYFRQYLPEFNALEISQSGRKELKRVLEAAGVKPEEVIRVLKKYNVKGKHGDLARRLQKEYMKAIRDHGNYTGASKMDYFQRELGKAKPRFRYRDVITLEIGEFKSINETLGHTGGDAFLTMVHMKVIQHVIKEMGIPRAHIMVAQKGANFKICISEEYLKKHPQIQKKFEWNIRNQYASVYASFRQTLDMGSGKTYSEVRKAWIENNKKATKEESLRAAKKIFITKEDTNSKK